MRQDKGQKSGIETKVNRGPKGMETDVKAKGWRMRQCQGLEVRGQIRISFAPFCGRALLKQQDLTVGGIGQMIDR